MSLRHWLSWQRLSKFYFIVGSISARVLEACSGVKPQNRETIHKIDINFNINFKLGAKGPELTMSGAIGGSLRKNTTHDNQFELDFGNLMFDRTVF